MKFRKRTGRTVKTVKLTDTQWRLISNGVAEAAEFKLLGKPASLKLMDLSYRIMEQVAKSARG